MCNLIYFSFRFIYFSYVVWTNDKRVMFYRRDNEELSTERPASLYGVREIDLALLRKPDPKDIAIQRNTEESLILLNRINNSKRLEVLKNGIRSIGFLAQRTGKEYEAVTILFNYKKRLAKIFFRYDFENVTIYCGEHLKKKLYGQYEKDRRTCIVDIESLRERSIFQKKFFLNTRLINEDNSAIVIEGYFEVSAFKKYKKCCI